MLGLRSCLLVGGIQGLLLSPFPLLPLHLLPTYRPLSALGLILYPGPGTTQDPAFAQAASSPWTFCPSSLVVWSQALKSDIWLRVLLYALLLPRVLRLGKS